MRARCLPCLGLSSVLFCALVLQRCSSDPSQPENRQQPLELLGSWQLTTTIISNTCGLPDSTTETKILILAENGDVLSVATSSGSWGIAQADGDTLYLFGEEASDDLGHTAMFHTEGSGLIAETEISGTLTTAVHFKPGNDVPDDCDITFSFVMTRLEERTRPDRAPCSDP